ncbi:MAG TPA: hypothetical protein VGF67_30430 [Ktedonobacteraceae bacterium]|jgi:hypothetical protein
MAPFINKLQRFLVERTTLRTWLVAVLAAVLGMSLLVFAQMPGIWHGLESVQSVVRDIGSLMLASIAVTLLLELGAKRAFLDELLSRVRLAKEIEQAGIAAVEPSFHNEIAWHELFGTVRELDIFLVHGRTWRKEHGERLIAAAKRGVRMRVVLPDPYDDVILSEIARRTNHSKQAIQERILLAKDEFSHLQTQGASITVWFLPLVPLFSFYRFDRKMILALYSHQREQKLGRLHVPAFLLEERGSLFQFIQADFEAMVDAHQGLARRV